MPEVTVEPLSDAPDRFRVTVGHGDDATQHEVRVPASYAREIAVEVDTAVLVEAAFGFLLEREPKEAILREFDLPVIERYFPDFRDRIKQHL